MIGTVSILGIITAVAVLVLAMSSFGTHGLSFGRSVRMAAAWAAIILALAIVLKWFGA